MYINYYKSYKKTSLHETFNRTWHLVWLNINDRICNLQQNKGNFNHCLCEKRRAWGEIAHVQIEEISIVLLLLIGFMMILSILISHKLKLGIRMKNV